jgi:hypothetical protein
MKTAGRRPARLPACTRKQAPADEDRRQAEGRREADRRNFVLPLRNFPDFSGQVALNPVLHGAVLPLLRSIGAVKRGCKMQVERSEIP